MKLSSNFHIHVFLLAVFTTFLVVGDVEAQGIHSRTIGEEAEDFPPRLERILLTTISGSATIHIAQHHEPNGPWGSMGPGADLATMAAEHDARETADLAIMWYDSNVFGLFDFELDGPFDVNVYYLGTSVVDGVPTYKYYCELNFDLYGHYWIW